MSDKLLKYNNMDKWDGCMPNRPDFFHDHWDISKCQDVFHLPKAFASMGRQRGFNIGIQKEMHRVSGNGINVDMCSVGKSDL